MNKEYKIETANNWIKHPIQKYDFIKQPEGLEAEVIKNILLSTMNDNRLVYLTARQMNIPYHVFCLFGDPNYVLFNARIVNISGEEKSLEETNISYPGISVKIKRFDEVRVRFQTPSGVTTTKTFNGLSSRFIQQSLDILEGLHFYERADWFNKKKAQKEWKNFQRKI